MKNLPVKELFIKDIGIDAVSLVEYPAIEEDFIYFNRELVEENFSDNIDEEKHIISGPILIPDKLIFRNIPDNHYVFFSKETVSEIAQKYLIEKKNDIVNIEHKDFVDGISLIESWVIDDPKMDKSVTLGFSNLTEGTWFGSYKVNNEEVWKSIKEKQLNGFSIQGMFLRSFYKVENKVESEDDKILNQIIELLKNN